MRLVPPPAGRIVGHSNVLCMRKKSLLFLFSSSYFHMLQRNIKEITLPIPVGSKVKFYSERQRYTVMASSEKFAVCTKPFNPRRTVIYTIIDFRNNIRGTENLVFCMGFENQSLCEAALCRLMSGESEVSHRNWIELDLERVQFSNPRVSFSNS